jgi:Telomere resolvase
MQELRDEYIPRIARSCEDLDPNGSVPEETITILSELKAFIDHTYARPEGMYSKVRKMISEAVGMPLVLTAARKIIRQNQKDFQALQRKAEKIVAFKNSHQTVLSMTYIRSVVTRLKTSTVFSDNVVLLMLSCGARKIEILDKETSTFFGHEDLPHRITQVGIAKKRREDDLSPITKPLLFITTTEFLFRLQRTREVVESREKKGKEAIGKTFSHVLEKLCQELWPQHVANGYRTGTHVNRAIYANVAYKKFGRAGESLTHFIKNGLGHDSMGTAAHYMNVSIAFDEESHLAKEAQKQAAVLDARVVNLEDTKGNEVPFFRMPIRWMMTDEREQLARDFARQLALADVPITRENLMELGVQSNIVTSSGVLEGDE